MQKPPHPKVWRLRTHLPLCAVLGFLYRQLTMRNWSSSCGVLAASTARAWCWVWRRARRLAHASSTRLSLERGVWPAARRTRFRLDRMMDTSRFARNVWSALPGRAEKGAEINTWHLEGDLYARMHTDFSDGSRMKSRLPGMCQKSATAESWHLGVCKFLLQVPCVYGAVKRATEKDSIKMTFCQGLTVINGLI